MVKIGLCVGRNVLMSNAVPIIEAVPYYPYRGQPVIPEFDNSMETRKRLLENIESIEEGISKTVLKGKEREALIKIRVNQGDFRHQLLDRYEHCCLCSVSNPALLIASHIKPWSESESSQKLDVENGFLLCPNHDKLFDSGLISFENDGKIIISNRLSNKDCHELNLNENIIVPLTEANKKYLSHHREYIFKKD